MAAVARLPWRLSRLAVIVTLAVMPVIHLDAQRPSEHQVKAAYLYSFGKFVTWPATGPTPAGQAFVICVLGEDPFGRTLDEVAAGATIQERPVRIQRISELADGARCDTLFISASEDTRLAGILDALARRPVLTVGDMPRFAQRGGMIGFSVDGSRVRFVVNIAAAQDAGLVLTSELLRVAATVVKSR